MIDVNIRAGLGDFKLNARFQVKSGITALFGPSGAGKTSLLRMIAGLETPDSGNMDVCGTTFFSSEKSINLGVRQRQVGMVSQNAGLFPHFTVLRNLTYANWAGKRKSNLGLKEICRMLGIDHLQHRRPDRLSGGERQRVAIGRAMLSDPSILLFDEPLSALDNERKLEIIPYLEMIRDRYEIPIIYISHSIDEIIRLVDHLVLMADGTVTEFGPIDQVLRDRNLKGTGHALEAGNLLYGKCSGLDQDNNLVIISIEGQDVFLPAADITPGDPSRLRIRPSDVALSLIRPANTSIQNMLTCTICSLEQISPSHVEVGLKLGEQIFRSTITKKAANELNLKTGLTCVALLKAMALEIHRNMD